MGQVVIVSPNSSSGGGLSTVHTDGASTDGDGSVGTPVIVKNLGVTAAKIANATITDTQVAAANKDGAAGTASMRTIGTGATQAAAGTTLATAQSYADTQDATTLAAAEAYTDTQLRNTDYKTAVRAAATVNLAGTRSSNVITANANVVLTKALIDSGWSTGATLAVNDRVLLAGQTSGVDNGVYVITSLGSVAVSPWVLTRSVDADASAKITSEIEVPVSEGTDANITYKLSVANPIALNTTALSFTRAGGPPSGSAGGDLGGTYPNPTVTSLVHAVANETIAGNKVFTGNSTFSGGDTRHVTNTAISYTVLATDEIIHVTGHSGNVLITLQGAQTAGRRIKVVDIDYKVTTYRIQVTAASGTVGKLGTFEFLFNGQAVEFVSDGTNWVNANPLPMGLIDPAAMPDITILTRFRADSSLITLVSSAVSDIAPLNSSAGYTDHLTQSTAGNRPTVATAWSGGKDALAFNGTSHYLATAAWAGAAVGNRTLFAVGSMTGTSTRLAVDGIAAGNRSFIGCHTPSVNELSIGAGTTLFSSSSSANTWDTQNRAVCALFNSTASRIYATGSYFGSAQRVIQGDANTNTMTGMTWGANYTGSAAMWNGNIAEAMLVSGLLDDATIGRILSYYNQYYRLSN